MDTKETVDCRSDRVVTVPLTLSNLAAFKRQLSAQHASKDSRAHNNNSSTRTSSLANRRDTMNGDSAQAVTTLTRVPTPTASTAEYRARLAEGGAHDKDMEERVDSHVGKGDDDDKISGDYREGKAPAEAMRRSGRGATPPRQRAADPAHFFATTTYSSGWRAEEGRAAQGTRTPPPPTTWTTTGPTRAYRDEEQRRSLSTVVVDRASVREDLDSRSGGSTEPSWPRQPRASHPTRVCTPPPASSPSGRELRCALSPRGDARSSVGASLHTPPRSCTSRGGPEVALDCSPAPRAPQAVVASPRAEDVRRTGMLEATCAPSPALHGPFTRGASPVLAIYYQPHTPQHAPTRERSGTWTPPPGIALSAGRSPQVPASGRGRAPSSSLQDGLETEKRADAAGGRSPRAPTLTLTRQESNGRGKSCTDESTTAIACTTAAGGEGPKVGEEEDARVKRPSVTLRLSTLSGYVWDATVSLVRDTPDDFVGQVARRLGFPSAHVQLKHVHSGWVATSSSPSAGVASASSVHNARSSISAVAPFVKANDLFLVILSSRTASPQPASAPSWPVPEHRSPKRERARSAHRVASTSRSPAQKARRLGDDDTYQYRHNRQKDDAGTTPSKSTSALVCTNDVSAARRTARTAGTLDHAAVSPARASTSVPWKSPQGRGVPPPLAVASRTSVVKKQM